MISSTHPSAPTAKLTKEELERRLLLALGLEGRQVTFVGLAFVVGQQPTVTVSMTMTEEMTDNVIQVVDNYNLVPKE